MMQTETAIFDRHLQRGILFVIACNMILLIINVLTYIPVLSNGGLLGFIAAIGILLVYGYLALFGPTAVGKLSNNIWRRGVYLGILSGIILSLDLVSGYLLHDPDTSARTSLIAYGLFLILILVSGIMGGRETGRITDGVSTALWCVLATLLIWFCVEFTAYLLFSNTANGAAFIRDEMQADFLRSGSSDYKAFALGDFFGAGFYHLMLGLILAGLLGSIGGAIGKVINTLRTSKVATNRP